MHQLYNSLTVNTFNLNFLRNNGSFAFKIEKEFKRKKFIRIKKYYIPLFFSRNQPLFSCITNNEASFIYNRN